MGAELPKGIPLQEDEIELAHMLCGMIRLSGSSNR